MKNRLNYLSLNKCNNSSNNTPKGNFEAYRGYKPLQVVGIVKAGFPTCIEETESENLILDDYIIDNKEASYILKVKGDSMIEAGIFEGDLVIVERGLTPKNGDIVIALIDGLWTMKYYRQTSNKTYLEPANKNYPLFLPQQELKIEAVVKAIVRKY